MFFDGEPEDQPPGWALQKADRLVKLWAQCRRFEKLPSAGGVLDQPSRVMRDIDWIESQYEARRPKPGER